MFRGICPTEVYDKIMSLKVDKSALDIPRICIKYAANHIYEALSMVFNQSLLQGIFPENFKVSKVTPIDKGGEEMDPFNYTLCTNPNFQKKSFVNSLLITWKSIKSYTSSNSALG